MSGEPSIFFSDVNERQGAFLRRTFVLGGATALGVAGSLQGATIAARANPAEVLAKKDVV